MSESEGEGLLIVLSLDGAIDLCGCESKTFFGGLFYFPYMMGLGQGNRAVPPT